MARGILQHRLSSLALVHLADERRSGSAKATGENEHVGHAVARAASKGGSAEGVFAGVGWRTGTRRRRRTFIDKRITPRALDPMTSTDACAATHRILNRTSDHQRRNASGFFAVTFTQRNSSLVWLIRIYQIVI